MQAASARTEAQTESVVHRAPGMLPLIVLAVAIIVLMLIGVLGTVYIKAQRAAGPMILRGGGWVQTRPVVAPEDLSWPSFSSFGEEWEKSPHKASWSTTVDLKLAEKTPVSQYTMPPTGAEMVGTVVVMDGVVIKVAKEEPMLLSVGVPTQTGAPPEGAPAMVIEVVQLAGSAGAHTPEPGSVAVRAILTPAQRDRVLKEGVPQCVIDTLRKKAIELGWSKRREVQWGEVPKAPVDVDVTSCFGEAKTPGDNAAAPGDKAAAPVPGGTP